MEGEESGLGDGGEGEGEAREKWGCSDFKKKKTYFHSNFAVWAFRILMGSRLPSRKIKDGWNMFENLSLLELISERRKVNIAIHPETVEEISPTTWVMMIKELTVI